MSHWGRTKVWTELCILASIRAFYKAHGAWPMTQDFHAHRDGLPHASTVWRAFGSLAEARRQAGAKDGGFEGWGGSGRGGGWVASKPWPPERSREPCLRTIMIARAARRSALHPSPVQEDQP